MTVNVYYNGSAISIHAYDISQIGSKMVVYIAIVDENNQATSWIVNGQSYPMYYKQWTRTFLTTPNSRTRVTLTCNGTTYHSQTYNLGNNRVGSSMAWWYTPIQGRNLSARAYDIGLCYALINQRIAYKNTRDNTSISLIYPSSYVNPEDDMLASDINDLIDAVNTMQGRSRISRVSRGDTITAELFNDISYYINNV